MSKYVRLALTKDGKIEICDKRPLLGFKKCNEHLEHQGKNESGEVFNSRVKDKLSNKQEERLVSFGSFMTEARYNIFLLLDNKSDIRQVTDYLKHALKHVKSLDTSMIRLTIVDEDGDGIAVRVMYAKQDITSSIKECDFIETKDVSGNYILEV